MDIEKLVPVGFKFEPTDEELITYYLLPKLYGMVLPCGIICEKVVYGQNSTPWEIFDDQKDPWIQSPKCKNKKTIYVFTKLKEKSKGKKQKERTAGCGTWDGQTAPKIIKNGDGKVIGSRKYFSFESRKLGNDKHDYIRNYGHWGMHEFSVSDGGDYVLCAITRDDSKRIVKKLHQETPLVDVIQSNINDLGSDQRTNGEESASGSVYQVALEELVTSVSSEVHRPLEELEVPLEEEVASEFDLKLLKEDTAPLQVQNEVLDQCNAFGNSSESQGSTMIEYQGFGNPGELKGSTMFSENLGDFQESTIIEFNGFQNLGEFQERATMDYWQLGDLPVNTLQNQGEGFRDDDIFDFSFLDAMPISMDDDIFYLSFLDALPIIMDDDIFDLSLLDGISVDEVSEPLFLENQVLGKRKFLEGAENPCGKKLYGTHVGHKNL